MDTAVPPSTSQHFSHIRAADHSRVHIGNLYGNQTINNYEYNENGLSTIIKAFRAEEDARYTRNESRLLQSEIEVQTRSIINSLEITEANQRREDVPEADRTTFSWLFESSHGAEGRPDVPLTQSSSVTFQAWLQRKSPLELFWISGKAGSGKTTLMKFIRENINTEKLLCIWAGERKLTIISHFFWHLGPESQKSRRGLLQSLVYQICQSDHQLTRSVFLEAEQFDTHLAPKPWSEEELWMSLTRLLAASSKSFCFLIDGLDEFHPQDRHYQLAQDVLSLAAISNVKVCVSSRPLHVFQGAFRRANRFKLEDLNREDLSAFASQGLRAAYDNSFYIDTITSRDINNLVDEIVTRSQGVFLWTRLVVHSVSERMAFCERLADIEQCLDHFPSELEDHFRNMYQRISPTWRTGKETSRCLKLALLLAREHISSFEWLHSSYSYKTILENEVRDIQEIIEAPFFDLMETLERQSHYPWESKIETCCGGLLAVQRQDNEALARVQFAHRTVYDFLISDEMRTTLDSHVPKHYFDGDFVARLLVWRCKILVKAAGTDVLYPKYHHTLYDNLLASIAMSADKPIIRGIEQIAIDLDSRFALPEFSQSNHSPDVQQTDDPLLLQRILRRFCGLGLYEYALQTIRSRPNLVHGFKVFDSSPDAAILFCGTWDERQDDLLHALVSNGGNLAEYSGHWLRAMTRLREYSERHDGLAFVQGFWNFTELMITNGVAPSSMERHSLWQTSFGNLRANVVLRLHIPPELHDEYDEIMTAYVDPLQLHQIRMATDEVVRAGT